MMSGTAAGTGTIGAGGAYGVGVGYSGYDYNRPSPAYGPRTVGVGQWKQQQYGAMTNAALTNFAGAAGAGAQVTPRDTAGAATTPPGGDDKMKPLNDR